MQICAECGTRNEDDEQFCGGCGSYLEWADEQAPAEAADVVPGADLADDGVASDEAPADDGGVLAPPTDDLGEASGSDGAHARDGVHAPPTDDVGDSAREADPEPAARAGVDDDAGSPGGGASDRGARGTGGERAPAVAEAVRADHAGEDRASAGGAAADADADADDPAPDGTGGGGTGGGRGALGVAAAAGAGLGAARALDRATGGRTGIGRATGGGGLGQLGSAAGRGRGGAGRLLRDVAGRAGVDTSGVDQARRAGSDVRRGTDQVRSSSTRVEDRPAASATKPAPARPAPTKPAPTKPAPTTPAGPAGSPAGVQPRRPAPVRPGAPAPRRRPVPAAEDEPPPAPGDLICGSCGAGNTPQRKFCRRCGASLADAPVQPQRAWWRRVLRPDRKPGPVAGTRPRARRNRRFPTGLVVTLVILGLLGFAGWTYRDRITGAFDSVLDRARGNSQVTPVHDVLHSSQAEGRTAVQARDGLSDRSWAPVPLGEAAEGEWIQFTFEEPFRLVHVLITGGNSADDEEKRLTEGRPRKVRLEMHTAAGGEPVLHEVTLEDTSGAQTFTFDGIDDVTGVRLTILSTYGATPETPVAVAEVEFRGRG